MLKVVSSENETIKLGYRIGQILKGGEVICLEGDLGAGKTSMTKGIGKALDIDGYITSPTFTIVNEYNGRIPLFHFDAYRLSGPEELFEIGFEDYMDRQGIIVIEWASVVKSALPQQCIWIEIKKDFNQADNVRKISIDFAGEGYKDIL